MTVSNKGLLHRLYEMFFSPTITADTGIVKARYCLYLDEEVLTQTGAANQAATIPAGCNMIVMWARGGPIGYLIGGAATGTNAHGGWLPENGGIKLRIDDAAGAVLAALGTWGAAGSFAHLQYFQEV